MRSVEKLLGMKQEEATKCRETLRGRPRAVTSKDGLRSMRGSLAHAEESRSRSESPYDLQRAATVLKGRHGLRGRGSHVDDAKETIRDVSTISSPSITSGSKRRSWGSPMRLLERVKTKKNWGLTSPSNGRLVGE